MNLRRVALPVVNLGVFILAGILLYHLSARRTGAEYGTEADEENLHVQTAVQVHVGNVERSTLNEMLSVYGRVEPAPATRDHPAASARVTVPKAARIVEVDCVEGQHVEKDQTLFRLDDREFKAQVALAKGLLDAGESAYDALADDRSAPTWAGTVAKLAINAAQANLVHALAQAKFLEIDSPVSGTVVALRVHPGEIADPAAPAVEIVDLNHLVVALDIPDFAAGRVATGQQVWLRAQPMEGLPVSGAATQPATQPDGILCTVMRVDSSVDPASQMTAADVPLPPGIAPVPGQFITATIQLAAHANCLVVPADAIVRDSLGRPRVALVTDSEHQAAFRIVDLGIRDGDNVELLGDVLREGDEIVTEGAYGLASRSGIVVVGR